MSVKLLAGDCRDVLATLPANSVHCCVTSPPYYGLRDYGTAQWDGGDAWCDHRAANARNDVSPERLAERAAQFGTGTGAGSKVNAMQFRAVCGKCGATRVDRQIGLEATPEAYLATMVGVFREVRRVLRVDGTCWVNMGDSYATSSGAGAAQPRERDLPNAPTGWASRNAPTVQRTAMGDYKPKDLLMMPARLALALQADGWWLRSDIIWSKLNPMPESVTDRPTSAHEHVFLLSKSARYYYDADAVREEQSEGTHERFGKNPAPSSRRKVSEAGSGIKNNDSFDAAMKSMILPNGRNMRNVWTIATAPYSEAHFATFPPALAERCIKAGTSERGCCSQCGKPWERTTERGGLVPTRKNHDLRAYGVVVDAPDAMDQGRNRARDGHRANMAYETTTTGWRADCDHEAPVVPCAVLDPFAGAGTTLLVADRLQRDAIGVELNVAYTEMAMERVRADAPLFTSPELAPPAADPEDERMADLFAAAAE
jgi:DNA modification methylase